MSGPAHKSPHGPDSAAIVIAALLGALAIIVLWRTASMPVAGQQTRVGPTTFPYVIGAGLAALAVGTLVSALRGSFPEREADRHAPIFWIVGGLVAQMVLLKTAGFSIATGVLFAMVARGFGQGPLIRTIPIGVVLAFVIYLIFAGLLQLSLPAGPIESLIF